MIRQGTNILKENAKDRLDYNPDLKQINFHQDIFDYQNQILEQEIIHEQDDFLNKKKESIKSNDSMAGSSIQRSEGSNKSMLSRKTPLREYSLQKKIEFRPHKKLARSEFS